MKNVLFLSLLISAGAYGMNDKINDFNDSDVVAIEHVDNYLIKKYLASLRNGDRVCACYSKTGPEKGLIESSRSPAEGIKKALSEGKLVCENVIKVYYDSTLYNRLVRLHKERNSSQAKQVASTSSVDSDATSSH